MSNLPEITHVIFDMDGLLIDSESLYRKVYEKVLAQFGQEYSLELQTKIMGRASDDIARTIIEQFSLPVSVQQFHDLFRPEAISFFSGTVPLMPGAENLVRHLHRHGIPIAVATSSTKKMFDIKTQAHQDLFGLFSHVVIASDDPEVTRSKPDPMPFLVCARRFPNPPKKMSSILVFEDSVNGILAANAAEMISVWVPDPMISKNLVKPYLTIDSLENFKPEKFKLPPF